MGYYTSYELYLESEQDYDNNIIEEFVVNNEIYALTEDGDTRESCKWYDHEEDLKVFSKKYPNVLFKLKGEGEEFGDIWIKYFKDGKCQVAKAIMTFPDFDESKLK